MGLHFAYSVTVACGNVSLTLCPLLYSTAPLGDVAQPMKT